jgi:hypothetical protein
MTETMTVANLDMLFLRNRELLKEEMCYQTIGLQRRGARMLERFAPDCDTS